MTRMILSQLRQRFGRSIALLLGILVATTGFTVLTASTSASHLQVTAAVNANAHSAYDILVRPAGSSTPLESSNALVRPNFLSGQYGGITMADWRKVQQIPGISVAAPVAMAGYVQLDAQLTVDLTSSVDRSKQTQMLRVDQKWSADRGLTSIPDPATQYVYVTKRPIIWPVWDDTQAGFHWADGKKRPPIRCDGKIGTPQGDVGGSPIELEPDGSERALCHNYAEVSSGYIAEDQPSVTVVQLLRNGTFKSGTGSGPWPDQLTTRLFFPMNLLLAGIDPQNEARLVGLDRAVTTGNYLPPAASAPATTFGLPIPVLATTLPYLDEQLSVTTNQLALPGDSDVDGAGWMAEPPAVPQILSDAAATPTMRKSFPADAQYQQLLTTDPAIGAFLSLLQVGNVKMTARPDGSLAPPPLPPAYEAIADSPRSGYVDTGALSRMLNDTAFRSLTSVDASTFSAGGVPRSGAVILNLVGTFDPTALAGFSSLSAVPLETYQSPVLAGADQRSRDLLGGKPLEPDSNAAGYASTPALLLTPLSSPLFADQKAPISAIRVRVAGVTGVDPVSREKVRLAAQQIQAATGLTVDVTVGASPAPEKVDLAAGKFGRPALTLTEFWSKKGVAVLILEEIDRKSLVLFVLILIVCILFLGNAVSAAVRDRRRELAVLACLGWPRRRLAALIGGEVALLGLVAGIISAALAVPVAMADGIRLSSTHAALAIPVAFVLALVATLIPAWRASRSHPAAAVGPIVRAPRRSGWRRRRRTILGLAMANLRRSFGRTLLGALALALGVAAATVLASVVYAFHNAITGTMLGDAVSLQVRGVDAVSVVATVVLGLFAVADVLYLNVRDRAAEFAALRATGWPERALGRLVLFEGLGIGVIGAVPGAIAGVVAASVFAGTAPQRLGWLAGAVAAAGVLLTGLAALIPALMQRRVPMSLLLAED